MPKVTIYTTPTCVYCKMTKEFLKKHGVAYGEKDVSSDAKAQEEMVAKSNQLGVPVIVVGDEFVVGFDEEKLSKLLNI